MADTSDILIVVGLAGAAYWYSKRRDDADARLDAQLMRAVRASRDAEAAGAQAQPPEAPVARVTPQPMPARSSAPRAPSAPAPPPPVAAHVVMTAPSSTPPSSEAPTRITRAFDPLFAAYGPTLPTAYLRALAAHESDMQPTAAGGPGRGLFSIVPIVLKDFNERHGTHFSLDDLLHPVVNAEIGADTIRRIVDSYAKNHPDVPNLREDWTNPRFVELVTFGWNGGFSERGGVGRVVSFLEHQGRRDLTIDIVVATAAAAGASAHLSDPRKARYCRDVTATYFRERARDEREGRATAPPAVPFGAAPLTTTAAEPTSAAPAHTPS